nr:hypothetical protein [Tanacetum cinerariifolium]
MALIKSVLVDRFQSKLSSWKSNLISIGGRVTLIKSVLGSMGIYYISLFKVPEMILKSLERFRANFFWGGDESSFQWWSFDVDDYSLTWKLAVKAKEVSRKGYGKAGLHEKSCKSAGLWSRIVGTVDYLHSSGVIPRGTLKYRVGCGTKVRFWKDIWIGDVPLKEKYSRLFYLDRNGDCVIKDRICNGIWS